MASHIARGDRRSHLGIPAAYRALRQKLVCVPADARNATASARLRLIPFSVFLVISLLMAFLPSARPTVLASEDGVLRELQTMDEALPALGDARTAAEAFLAAFSNWTRQIEFERQSLVIELAIEPSKEDSLLASMTSLIASIYAERTLARDRLDHLRRLSRRSHLRVSASPILLGILAGILIGIALPLWLGELILRRVEVARFGARIFSHPLRDWRFRLCAIVATIIGTTICITMLVLAGMGELRQDQMSPVEDAAVRVRNAMEAFRKALLSAASNSVQSVSGDGHHDSSEAMARFPDLEPEIERLTEYLTSVSELRENALEGAEDLRDLRKEVMERESELRQTGSLAETTDPTMDHERALVTRLSALRNQNLIRFWVPFMLALLVAGGAVTLGALSSHRAWYARKRRGSYNGW